MADTPHPNPSPEEEGHFTQSATRLAGLAGAVLGWRPDEFWSATPAELATILHALTPQMEAAGDGSLIARLQEQFPDG